VESSNSFLDVADVPLAWGVGYPVAGGASYQEHAREPIAGYA
jgi:arginase family enzyme